MRIFVLKGVNVDSNVAAGNLLRVKGKRMKKGRPPIRKPVRFLSVFPKASKLSLDPEEQGRKE